jgi:TPR repeat protein
MKLIEQAADCGDASACNLLSNVYAQGALGKARDLRMSAKWAQSAQDHEHFAEYGLPFDLEVYGITLPKPQIEWTSL